MRAALDVEDSPPPPCTLTMPAPSRGRNTPTRSFLLLPGWSVSAAATHPRWCWPVLTPARWCWWPAATTKRSSCSQARPARGQRMTQRTPGPSRPTSRRRRSGRTGRGSQRAHRRVRMTPLPPQLALLHDPLPFSERASSMSRGAGMHLSNLVTPVRVVTVLMGAFLFGNRTYMHLHGTQPAAPSPDLHRPAARVRPDPDRVGPHGGRAEGVGLARHALRRQREELGPVERHGRRE